MLVLAVAAYLTWFDSTEKPSLAGLWLVFVTYPLGLVVLFAAPTPLPLVASLVVAGLVQAVAVDWLTGFVKRRNAEAPRA